MAAVEHSSTRAARRRQAQNPPRPKDMGQIARFSVANP